MQNGELARALLRWYDRHARVMPWRIGPGATDRADPYRIWLSEVMLQQTTVAAVQPYFQRFTTRWPTVVDLAAAPEADVMAAWAGLGYYARARNLVKCARDVVARHNGRFPDTRAGLLDLPGIGPYTASAIAAIAFGRVETVVDGNVERVIARLRNVQDPLPGSKPVLTALAAELTDKDRPGDYAQAVMDLGATICTPRNPACGLCPWRDPCAARQAGTAADLPRKTPKVPPPTRFGLAYVARRIDGALLLETRPAQGLLGGMLGFPGSDWSDSPTPAPPCDADWHILPGQARHTFTHFHLRLTVLTATVGQNATPSCGQFIPKAEFRPSFLPTVMRKVHDLAAAT